MISTLIARAEEFRRDDDIGHPAFGVAGRGLDDGVGVHGDGLGLARVQHGDAQGKSRGQRGSDAADLGGEDFIGLQMGKARGQRAADGQHQRRIDLVVDETVDLQNSVAEIDALASDAFLEYFHRRPPRYLQKDHDVTSVLF